MVDTSQDLVSCPTCGGNLAHVASVRERTVLWLKRHRFDVPPGMENLTLERILDYALYCQARRTLAESRVVIEAALKPDSCRDQGGAQELSR
jgi:hypothetical protein